MYSSKLIVDTVMQTACTLYSYLVVSLEDNPWSNNFIIYYSFWKKRLHIEILTAI